MNTQRSGQIHERFRRSLAIVALTVMMFGIAFGQSTADDLGMTEQQALQAAVSAVAESVVQVQTIGGLEKVEKMLASTSPTSGVVVSEDGLIISSSFNFAQKPSAVLVTLPSGREHAAKVVSEDKSRRLVLLKIETEEKLQVPKTVDRQELSVGQWAVAVGKSFDASQPNVSVGIVSATQRIWGRAVQTDAKVSPANYGGPLIDLRGRIIGLLVPLSTEDGSQLAGAEMYDSGIGFAVPLNEIQTRLEDMIAGKELMPGLLGLTLTTKDLYRGELEVASTAPKSPARIAGILPGDKILEIAEREVSNQSQLKHAIGPLYGGDEITVVLNRDGAKRELQLTLADQIEPYVLPFLGVLPERDRDDLVVRFVIPKSPADEAGLAAGDQLIAMADSKIASVEKWRATIAALEPEQSATIEFVRDGKASSTEVTVAEMPESIPESIPPASEKPADKTTTTNIQLPAEANVCWAIVPSDIGEAEQADDVKAANHPPKQRGLLVWLAPPDFEPRADAVERWSDFSRERNWIVLVPQPLNKDRWLPTEASVVRKFIDEATSRYSIDPARVVVHGFQSGGSMAHRVALANRDAVRGVAVVDATTPRGAEFRSNDPLDRLAYYLVNCEKSKYSRFMDRDAKGLRTLKFPVSQATIDGAPRYLDKDEQSHLAVWLDSLDRL